jgi:hypothetical protein
MRADPPLAAALDAVAHRYPFGHRWGFDDGAVTRVHSLPHAKQFADGAEEYAEILHRHRSELRELAGADDTRVLLFTFAWSMDAAPVPRAAAVARLVTGHYWRTTLMEPAADGDPVHEHWYLTEVSLGDAALGSALLLVADDIEEATILPYDLGWEYRPYAGGADIRRPLAGQPLQPLRARQHRLNDDDDREEHARHHGLHAGGERPDLVDQVLDHAEQQHPRDGADQVAPPAD